MSLRIRPVSYKIINLQDALEVKLQVLSMPDGTRARGGRGGEYIPPPDPPPRCGRRSGALTRSGFSALSHPVQADFGNLATAWEAAFRCLLLGIPWIDASSKT